MPGGPALASVCLLFLRAQKNKEEGAFWGRGGLYSRSYPSHYLKRWHSLCLIFCTFTVKPSLQKNHLCLLASKSPGWACIVICRMVNMPHLNSFQSSIIKFLALTLPSRAPLCTFSTNWHIFCLAPLNWILRSLSIITLQHNNFLWYVLQ